VVYTQNHRESFADLDEEGIRQLVDVWLDRYRDLGSRKEIAYVFIFENRGDAVGVTLPHPHGQIYAYPFIPPVADHEMRAGRAHARRHRECLQCALIDSERSAGERLLFLEQGVAAYVPAYARWPYEVHVAPVNHHGALPDLSQTDRAALGQALQRVAAGYDRLFNQPMPYMMAMHQRPTDGRPHAEAHLHVEFYPVLRSPGRLKYLAGGECGAGTFVSDGLPEEKAAELKRVI
jgi:UDPglucose--hexose-1-phosphate uridylyltransferase